MIRGGDVAERSALIPALRQDHRQRRVDRVVRPPDSAGLDHSHRHADPARRSRRSARPTTRRTPTTTPGVSARSRGSQHRRARRSHRAGARGTQQLLRARVLQAAGSQRRGHAAGLDLRHLRSEGDRAGQYLDADGSGRCWSRKLGGAVVATHSQSGIMGHHMVRILKERGHLDLLKGLITIEGSCSLPNSGLKAEDFDNIPYLALKGDYTATSEVCQTTVDAINARRAAGPRNREGGIHQAGRARKPGLQGHHAHDDAGHEQPRSRRRDPELDRRERPQGPIAQARHQEPTRLKL